MLEKRILETVMEGATGNTVYKPRAGGGMNKNLEKYNPEQMKYIMSEIEELLHYWGYAKEEGNKFGFFDYKGQASEYSRSRYEGFRK